MTGQSLLDRMEMLDRELQCQPGEADVTRALVALNAAQDHFETLISNLPMAGSTTGTVSTTAGQEYTTFPSGLLRLDRLQYLDPNTGLPSWDLEHITDSGGQLLQRSWPWNLVSTNTQGRPVAYWEDGEKLWWMPIPDSTYTIRYYGLVAAADITAGGTFTYRDSIGIPLASVAVELLKAGLEDDPSQMDALASRFLAPSIRQMDRRNRDGAYPFKYARRHEA